MKPDALRMVTCPECGKRINSRRDGRIVNHRQRDASKRMLANHSPEAMKTVPQSKRGGLCAGSGKVV